MDVRKMYINSGVVNNKIRQGCLALYAIKQRDLEKVRSDLLGLDCTLRGKSTARAGFEFH